MQRNKILVQSLLSSAKIRHVSHYILFLLLSLFLMSFITDGKIIKVDQMSKKDSTNNITHGAPLDMEALNVELNPKVVPFVNNYIKREITDLESMKEWGRVYLDLYDKVLEEYNLPIELKYLSVVESSLQSDLVSSAGAVGPWQLMADEAKRYGLKRGKGIDERKNFLKSTIAASQLLSSLYSEFGDWVLVLAAYNAGDGRVKKAISKAGSRDYWDLEPYLPAETRSHVKKFMATHYYFEGQGGITTMTTKETRKYNKELLSHNNAFRTHTGAVIPVSSTKLSGTFNSKIIIEALSIDPNIFSKLNPEFDKKIKADQTYELRLPKEKMIVFQEMKKQIRKESTAMEVDSMQNANAALKAGFSLNKPDLVVY